MLEKYIVLTRPAAPLAHVSRAATANDATQEVAVRQVELRPAAARGVVADPEVLACAPVMPMTLHRPLAASARAPDTRTAWGVSAVGADKSGFTGIGVSVAVLDTGINRDHPAFKGLDVREEDFTGEGNGDLHGHGTHCAGTIFGRAVDGIRIGVAPGVSTCYIGKVLTRTGQGTSERIVKGLFWAADQGANVITLSLGVDFPGYVKQLTDGGLPVDIATSRALDGFRLNLLLFATAAAHVKARAPNSVIIAAAGNESRANDNIEYKVSVAPPAIAEGFISVGAIDRELTVAGFSNSGATVVGPGVDIHSASHTGGLVAMSGTSMAAPHVAGVAALWAEKVRNAGIHSQLSALLVGRATAEALAAGFDPADIGSGLVRAPQ